VTRNGVRAIIYLLIGLVLVYLIAREPYLRWLGTPDPTVYGGGRIVNHTRGEPPLSVAVEAGDLAAARNLLDHGADVHGIGNDGMPLEAAIVRKHPEIVRLLLARRADPNRYRYNPPLRLAESSMPAVVPELLRRGARVDVGALCAAIRSRQTAEAKLLIERGAPVNLGPRSKLAAPTDVSPSAAQTPIAPQSPLAVAACHAPELEKALLSHGARLGPDDATILVWAARQKRAALISHLLALGADPNGVSAGESPLTQAVLTCPDAVPILLAHGARPDYLTSDGRTPLREAAMAGDERAAGLLIAHRADVNYHAAHGHGPLWFARKHNHARVAELLQKAGGRDD